MLSLFKRIPKSPEEKAALRRDRILLILSGLATGLAFSPSPFPFLLFFSLVPLFIVLQNRTTLAETNRAMFLFGMAFSLVSIYWVSAPTMQRDIYLLLGGSALFVLNPAIMLIASTLYHAAAKAIGKPRALLLMPFFWVCYEYCYMITDWSFPWANIGNGVASFTLYIQIADTVGAGGLSLLLLFTNVSVYLLYKSVETRRRILFAGVTGVLIVLPLLYGTYRLATIKADSFPSTKVGVIQPNIDPYDKWSDAQPDKLIGLYKKLSTQTIQSGARLVLWPETAVPVYIAVGAYSDIMQDVRSYIDTNRIPLLTGVPDIRYYNSKEEGPPDVKVSESKTYFYANYNAAYMFNPGSPVIQKYGKIKLVPFGERTPFVDQIPFLGELLRWGVGLGGWNVGRDTVPFQYAAGNDTIKTGAMICYESIYPEISATLTVKGAQFLTVITNDSWYGNTSGAYQHRDFAKLRAVENRRTFIRCANGGISCIVYPNGNIIEQTSMYTQDARTFSVPLNTELTAYSKHPLFIYRLASYISIAMMIFAFIQFLKARAVKK